MDHPFKNVAVFDSYKLGYFKGREPKFVSPVKKKNSKPVGNG